MPDPSRPAASPLDLLCNVAASEVAPQAPPAPPAPPPRIPVSSIVNATHFAPPLRLSSSAPGTAPPFLPPPSPPRQPQQPRPPTPDETPYPTHKMYAVQQPPYYPHSLPHMQAQRPQQLPQYPSQLPQMATRLPRRMREYPMTEASAAPLPSLAPVPAAAAAPTPPMAIATLTRPMSAPSLSVVATDARSAPTGSSGPEGTSCCSPAVGSSATQFHHHHHHHHHHVLVAHTPHSVSQSASATTPATAGASPGGSPAASPSSMYQHQMQQHQRQVRPQHPLAFQSSSRPPPSASIPVPSVARIASMPSVGPGSAPASFSPPVYGSSPPMSSMSSAAVIVQRSRSNASSATNMKNVTARTGYKGTGRRDSYTRFTSDEETMLLDGVRIYGVGNWKKILNSYNFHRKRTAVDLKDKYRNITRAKMRRMNNTNSQTDLSSVASVASDGDSIMQSSPLQGSPLQGSPLGMSPLTTPASTLSESLDDRHMVVCVASPGKKNDMAM